MEEKRQCIQKTDESIQKKSSIIFLCTKEDFKFRDDYTVGLQFHRLDIHDPVHSSIQVFIDTHKDIIIKEFLHLRNLDLQKYRERSHPYADLIIWYKAKVHDTYK